MNDFMFVISMILFKSGKQSILNLISGHFSRGFYIQWFGNKVASLLLIILANLITSEASLQDTIYPMSSIDVSLGASPLSNPFVGGLRAPQFSMADLNLDGRSDLVIFDRVGGVFSPLISEADPGSYHLDITYRTIFPPVKNWILMRDFNNDGIQDIFCSPTASPIPGIEVWKGSVTNGQLTYDLVTFPDRDFDILYVPIGTGFSQIFVSIVDLPDIKDIDGDGDLDIVAFEPSGTTVFLYQNMQVEKGLPVGSLDFVIGDNCYGKFLESGFSQDVILSDDSTACPTFFHEDEPPSTQLRHAGSTVTLFDLDSDGRLDILLGDISYNGLVSLKNSGSNAQAWVTDPDPLFPSNAQEPVQIQIFNAAYFEDLDGDGVTEMIVAPNDRIASQTEGHIWVFELPTAENSDFQLDTKSFLLDQMVHTGDNSSPVFFDYNGDELIDLLVGTGGLSTDGLERHSRLILFENVGSATDPKYRIVDSDYLAMSQFENTSRSYYPAIGDLDNDTDIDIVIGDNTGRLYFAENRSSDPDVYDFGIPEYDAFDIKVSASARPEIFDFNQDGLGDLIIGEQNFNSFNGIKGSLNYFQNTGVSGIAAFNPDVEASPNSPVFGQIFTKETGFINNFASPRVIWANGSYQIATGTESGNIKAYELPLTEPGDSVKQISQNLGQIYEGPLSTVSFADIDNDNLYEMAIGTRRGGLAIFETDLAADQIIATSETEVSSSLEIYPNPVSNDVLYMKLADQSCQECRIEVYTGTGILILSHAWNPNELQAVDTRALTPGLYFVRVIGKEMALSKKFVRH